MALTVVRVSSTDGAASDTQASGAGPPTALFGTTDASFSGATVTLTAGTDLSGVATDGSHVLYLLTSTGVRFFKITAKAGSGGATPTVDVTPSPAGTSTGRTWAIGGVRASIGSASSKLLFDNASAAGDAMPGWVVECQSGHTETITATLDLRRSGDTTSGPITFRGASGTRPILTFSNNGTAIVLRGNYQIVDNIELRNSNATKTASVGIANTQTNVLVRRVIISHATDKFWKGMSLGVGAVKVQDCDVGNCANVGIDFVSTTGNEVTNCWIHDCGSHGISVGAPTGGSAILGNLIESNAGDGINSGFNGGSAGSLFVIANNTIHGNTSDGLEHTAATIRDIFGYLIYNNIFSANAYGINFSSGSITQALLDAYLLTIRGNSFYGSVSDKYNPSTLTNSLDEQTADPSFTNAAGNDFSIGTNLKAKGYPVGGTLPVGTTSSTYSYVDPGVAQRQEAGGGGGGMVRHPGMNGGCDA